MTHAFSLLTGSSASVYTNLNTRRRRRSSAGMGLTLAANSTLLYIACWLRVLANAAGRPSYIEWKPKLLQHDHGLQRNAAQALRPLNGDVVRFEARSSRMYNILQEPESQLNVYYERIKGRVVLRSLAFVHVGGTRILVTTSRGDCDSPGQAAAGMLPEVNGTLHLWQTAIADGGHARIQDDAGVDITYDTASTFVQAPIGAPHGPAQEATQGATKRCRRGDVSCLSNSSGVIGYGEILTIHTLAVSYEVIRIQGDCSLTLQVHVNGSRVALADLSGILGAHLQIAHGHPKAVLSAYDHLVDSLDQHYLGWLDARGAAPAAAFTAQDAPADHMRAVVLSQRGLLAGWLSWFLHLMGVGGLQSIEPPSSPELDIGWPTASEHNRTYSLILL